MAETKNLDKLYHSKKTSTEDKEFIADLMEQIEAEDFEMVRHFVASFIYGGFHTPDKDEKAIILALLDDCVAAEESWAMSLYGMMYQKGWIMHADINKAVEYYERAAQYNDKLAFLQLGEMYRSGVQIPADHEKAFQYFVQCQLMEDNVEAKGRLAFMYMDGDYVPANPALAIQMMEDCVNEHDMEDDMDELAAQIYYRLGACYETGTGEDVDCEQALDYLQQAEMHLIAVIRGGDISYYDMLDDVQRRITECREEIMEELPQPREHKHLN